ncbi:MAG: hypothetical protein A2Y12_04070 [Planctomycetes bacterium GWF2_42_9]|nr:MAG: hypothetical protein A2Y12_04070 [Planctomycetes bacterium GWF2_42_9]
MSSTRVVRRILILGLLLCWSGLAQAITSIDFNSVNPVGTINTGNIYDRVTLHDSAIVTMTGGMVGSISAFDHSTVNVTGGSIDVFYLYDSQSATVNLFGGDIAIGFHGLLNASNAINIYGKDFVVWQNQSNTWLAGKWADNSDFEFYFLRSSGLPSIVSLHTVPEPLTATLLAFGGSLIFYKRKPNH